MKFSEMHPSRWLKAEDFDQPCVCVIASIQLEPVGPDEKLKHVIRFQGVEKGLTLNKTNASILAKLFGDHASHAIGQAVEIYAAQTDLGPGVRMRRPAQAAAAQPAAPPMPAAPTQPNAYAAAKGGGDPAWLQETPTGQARTRPWKTKG